MGASPCRRARAVASPLVGRCARGATAAALVGDVAFAHRAFDFVNVLVLACVLTLSHLSLQVDRPKCFSTRVRFCGRVTCPRCVRRSPPTGAVCRRRCIVPRRTHTSAALLCTQFCAVTVRCIGSGVGCTNVARGSQCFPHFVSYFVYRSLYSTPPTILCVRTSRLYRAVCVFSVFQHCCDHLPRSCRCHQHLRSTQTEVLDFPRQLVITRDNASIFLDASLSYKIINPKVRFAL